MAETDTGFLKLLEIEKQVREEIRRAKNERGPMQPAPLQPTKESLMLTATVTISSGMKGSKQRRGMDAEFYFRAVNTFVEGRESEHTLRQAYSRHPFGRPFQERGFD